MSQTSEIILSVWAMISFFANLILGIIAIEEYSDLVYHVGDGAFCFWRSVFFTQCLIYREAKREINKAGIKILELVVSPFLIAGNVFCLIFNILQIVFCFICEFYCFIFRRKDDEQ